VQDPDLQHLRDGRLGRNLAQLSRITDELQRTAMSLRMVPIRSTFQKMNRLVRDLASRQGKQVELVLSGEDTELDRTIVEELNDPLVHMIRNSIDHGIEKPEVRLAKGKSAQGIIRLSAGHQGGNIVIKIQDDGSGLNRERILAKAIDQGMVNPNENLTEGAIFQLIFAPGFSTAEIVTDISGRGVGMDVVRRNIEKLRGKIEIESTPGQGSTFTIFLPLTLAIIDGLLVGVGKQRFILPTLLVRESFRPVASMISTVHSRAEMIQVRGKLSPMLRLHEYFNVPPRSTNPTQGIIVVVGTERDQRCLLVDDLLGKQEVVIKSLGETFKQNRAIAGAAILGDGCVGLILNVDYLTRPKAQSLKKAA
jgi:two-component system, chemotaxis family, sensor kinase CheA